MSKIKARIGGDERTGNVRATGSASRVCVVRSHRRRVQRIARALSALARSFPRPAFSPLDGNPLARRWVCHEDGNARISHHPQHLARVTGGSTQISLDEICYPSQYAPRRSDNHLRVVLPAPPTPSRTPRRATHALATSRTPPTPPTASRTSWEIEIAGDLLETSPITYCPATYTLDDIKPRCPSQVRDSSVTEH
ncbi:hypothetical protein EV715DRAFT_297867 [Schizophyllum commune]